MKDVEEYLPYIDRLPTAEKQELLKLLDQYEKAVERETAQVRFLPFVKQVWPGFIEGKHHRQMAEAFEKVASGELKRVIISMPPRHTKSEFASYLLPAWFLGMFPEKKIIQASHTSELAVGFGRKVRNLLNDDAFKEVFPGVELSTDSKSASRWNTNKKGEYFAVGVGGAVTGKGADIFIIDDPVSEQDAAAAESNPEVYDRIYEWYTSGPRQRLQPGGAIIIVMTRWSKRDLVGRVLKRSMETGGEDWHYIELPAILPSGEPLWPEFWSLKELKALESELPLPKWMAQYQQQPTSTEGAIIKKEWWHEWPHESPPVCDFIIQSWDTAYTKSQRADFSACTTWGVFNKEHPDTGVKTPNLILLDAFQERLEFPDLKVRAMKMYEEWEPDAFIIEAKAAGAPLVFELRQMGIPVQDFTPSRGNDKIVRANAVADIFSSGIVWHPPTRWAEEVIEQCAEFPAGEHDDLVDSTTQALLRFRQGGFIRTTMDEEDEEPIFNLRRKYGYF